MNGDDGRSLEQLGRAAHAAGDYKGAAEAYEQAFAAYRRDGDLLAAGRAARTVGWFRGWVFGDWAVHRGWIARGRRLLESAEGERARGWVLLDDALGGNDFQSQRRQYDEAIALARRTGDHDLECDATASLGMMLVFSGHVEEGMANLDEALAAICGGEVVELPVIEGCLCGLLTACERTHDLGRADEWLRATQRVIQRGNLLTVAGHCRAHYAGILIASGRWDDADDELTSVLDLLPGGLGVTVTARCRLADLRVRQGRLEDAERLLGGVEDHEDAVLPTVALHLARARPHRATELLDRVLTGDHPDHVTAPLLAALVESRLAAGEVDLAEPIAVELASLAGNQASLYVRAVAAASLARVATARGIPTARPLWHEALNLFLRCNRPVDAAAARLEIACLIADDRPDAAIAELEAAFVSFDAAGDRRGADRATSLLRLRGGRPRTGPKRQTPLTRREEEVLELLAHGLTNAEIGQRLFISPKTVEHHVGRVLAKLGLRNRAEAAVLASRPDATGIT